MPDDKAESFKSDIPSSVFEEALRAVENIQKTAKDKKSEKKKAENGNPSEDADEFLRWLREDEKSPAKPKQTIDLSIEDEEIDDELGILSKLLEEEKNLEKEALLLKSFLFDKKDESVIDETALKEKEGRIQELSERLVHMKAEFENFKKRIERDKEKMVQFSNENLIGAILPVIDNFERALSHADATTDPKALIEGVRLILQQLRQTLDENGVQGINAEGHTFDPAYHEAMASVVTDEVEPNRVIAQYQKGYLLHGRLLRPAKVVVSATSQKHESHED